MPLMTLPTGAQVDRDFYTQAMQGRRDAREDMLTQRQNIQQSIGGAGMPLLSAGQTPVQEPVAPGGGGMAVQSNPYNIDGRLDFGAAGANFDFSGNPAAMGQNYANTYMDALRLNAQNYGNIMGGYNQTMNNQLAAQDQLNQNYTGLGDKVQGMIAGTDQAQMQRINDNYNSAMGSMNQGAINRGLGNTTVTNALARGIESDRAQEQTNVQNQFAQLQAGYASNIGLAGLNQQGHNIDANTGLAGRQLSFMESVNAPYPNPALYNQLGQQLGQGQQGIADRGQFQDQLRRLQDAGRQGSGQTGLNAGGGGGVRQSAFGPGASGGNQYPGLGPSATGSGISSGGGGVRPPTGGSGGGGGLGGAGLNAAGRGVAPGGYGPGSPAGGGLGSVYGGAGGYVGGGYDSGLFGGAVDWAYQTQQDSGGYGWNDDGSMYYDASQDFSDGQWAGADWAYYEDPGYTDYGGYDLSYEDSAYGGYDTSWYDPGWFDDAAYSDQGSNDWYDTGYEDSAYGGYSDTGGYGWDDGGYLSYDAGSDYSDGQWAGADWAYYE